MLSTQNESVAFQLRRGTTAQHATFIGLEGELTYNTEKKCLVAHDGVTPGGKECLMNET